jgi:hypothetical protein
MTRERRSHLTSRGSLRSREIFISRVISLYELYILVAKNRHVSKPIPRPEIYVSFKYKNVPEVEILTNFSLGVFLRQKMSNIYSGLYFFFIFNVVFR